MIHKVKIYKVDAFAWHDGEMKTCPFCTKETDQLYVQTRTMEPYPTVRNWRCLTCFILRGMDDGSITLPPKGWMPEGWDVPPGCGHGVGQGAASFGLRTFCRVCAGKLEERAVLLGLAELRPQSHAAVVGGVDCYVACGDEKNQAECWLCNRTVTIWVSFDRSDLSLCTGCVDQAIDVARRLQPAIAHSSEVSGKVAE